MDNALKPQIILHGGHHNLGVIDDHGKSILRIGVSKQYDWDGTPSIGSVSGYAIYEFDENDRSKAYFLDNVWDGVTLEVIKINK
tara:strand:- start:989 stop:1240 length:252 start_codon:yes stop_codon:yes gene_type:complete